MRTVTAFEIDRGSLGEGRVLTADAEPLADGQVRLAVDHVAVTANNVTYAVFGDELAYWDFFPTGDPGWGRVPAMGWATIVESRHPDLALGTRYYGWYPMATSVVVDAVATTDGFRDVGAHRAPHAPVYRAFVETGRDPLLPAGDPSTDPSADVEHRHALLRGLFLTGFLAEEFFADGGGSGDPYFGAARVVVLSASSKTAIGFAQRAAARGAVEVVGATSARNVDFVRSLGCYDTVVGYGDLATVELAGGAVSIDMAGNPEVLGTVHRHFGDGLAWSMTVGRSHHDAPPVTDDDLPGPPPQLFFAPSEVGRRREQWGRAEFAARTAAALRQFVDASRDWLTVDRRDGAAAFAGAWSDVYSGSVGPDVGIVVVPGA